MLEHKLQRSTGKLKGVIRERRKDWGEVNGRVDGGGEDDVRVLGARNRKSLKRRKGGGKEKGGGRGRLGLGDGEMDVEYEDGDGDDGLEGGDWVDEDREEGEEKKGGEKRRNEGTVVGDGNMKGTDRIATEEVEHRHGGAAHQGDSADIDEIL